MTARVGPGNQFGFDKGVNQRTGVCDDAKMLETSQAHIYLPHLQGQR